MKSYGDIDLNDNNLLNACLDIDNMTVPPNPVLGQMVITNKKVWICTAANGSSSKWLPITNTVDSSTYTQPTPQTVWTISVNFDTSNVHVQAYDLDGNVVYPTNIDVSVVGQITITFGEPVAGKAIMVHQIGTQAGGGSSSGSGSSPNTPTMSFSSKTWPTSINRGETKPFELKIVPLYGFTEDVTITITSTPVGATVVLDSSLIVGGTGTVTGTISSDLSAGPLGTQNIGFSAQSVTLTKSLTKSLAFTEPLVFSFVSNFDQASINQAMSDYMMMSEPVAEHYPSRKYYHPRFNEWFANSRFSAVNKSEFLKYNDVGDVVTVRLDAAGVSGLVFDYSMKLTTDYQAYSFRLNDFGGAPKFNTTDTLLDGDTIELTVVLNHHGEKALKLTGTGQVVTQITDAFAADPDLQVSYHDPLVMSLSPSDADYSTVNSPLFWTARKPGAYGASAEAMILPTVNVIDTTNVVPGDHVCNISFVVDGLKKYDGSVYQVQTVVAQIPITVVAEPVETNFITSWHDGNADGDSVSSLFQTSVPVTSQEAVFLTTTYVPPIYDSLDDSVLVLLKKYTSAGNYSSSNLLVKFKKDVSGKYVHHSSAELVFDNAVFGWPNTATSDKFCVVGDKILCIGGENLYSGNYQIGHRGFANIVDKTAFTLLYHAPFAPTTFAGSTPGAVGARTIGICATGPTRAIVVYIKEFSNHPSEWPNSGRFNVYGALVEIQPDNSISVLRDDLLFQNYLVGSDVVINVIGGDARSNRLTAFGTNGSAYLFMTLGLQNPDTGADRGAAGISISRLDVGDGTVPIVATAITPPNYFDPTESGDKYSVVDFLKLVDGSIETLVKKETQFGFVTTFVISPSGDSVSKSSQNVSFPDDYPYASSTYLMDGYPGLVFGVDLRIGNSPSTSLIQSLKEKYLWSSSPGHPQNHSKFVFVDLSDGTIAKTVYSTTHLWFGWAGSQYLLDKPVDASASGLYSDIGINVGCRVSDGFLFLHLATEILYPLEYSGTDVSNFYYWVDGTGWVPATCNVRLSVAVKHIKLDEV